MAWVYGKTISRHGASNHFDITPEMTEKVSTLNLFEDFSICPGTINIDLENDLIFEWHAIIPAFRWKASHFWGGAKLHECTFGSQNEKGEWKDCRAFIYDPDNPNDSYLGNPRCWEIFASEEFPHLRGRGERQYKVRIAL